MGTYNCGICFICMLTSQHTSYSHLTHTTSSVGDGCLAFPFVAPCKRSCRDYYSSPATSVKTRIELCSNALHHQPSRQASSSFTIICFFFLRIRSEMLVITRKNKLQHHHHHQRRRSISRCNIKEIMTLVQNCKQPLVGRQLPRTVWDPRTTLM